MRLPGEISEDGHLSIKFQVLIGDDGLVRGGIEVDDGENFVVMLEVPEIAYIERPQVAEAFTALLRELGMHAIRKTFGAECTAEVTVVPHGCEDGVTH